MPSLEFNTLIGLVLTEALPHWDMEEIRHLVDVKSVKILEEIREVVLANDTDDCLCREQLICILEDHAIL